MKAYWVQVKNADWGMYIHANTVGQAKSSYSQSDPELERADFISLRCRRVKDLDDKPFLDGVMEEAGYIIDQEFVGMNIWLDFCSCYLCAGADLAVG